MADFQEEVYIIEKKEISEDEFDDEEFQNVDPSIEDAEDLDLDDDDLDLNDFNALKAKTEQKMTRRKELSNGGDYLGATGRSMTPKTNEMPVVIDDFIRNFLTQLKMNKTMNTF